MDVNDNACFLDKRVALRFIASKLAPTNNLKSDPICTLGHHLGHQAHPELHRRRKTKAPSFQRTFGMLLFINTHLLKNRPGLFVLGRQLLKAVSYTHLTLPTSDLV